MPDASRNMPPLAVVCGSPDHEKAARRLAASLNTRLGEIHHEPCLLVDDAGVALLPGQSMKPLRCDFTTGPLGYRLQHNRVRHERVVRAMGKTTRTVIDATAGLGRDGVMLACAGFTVTMIEKNPMLHALLADGLARAGQLELFHEHMQRITLMQADSVIELENLQADVVYLDPMYAGAADGMSTVRKEAAVLRALTENQTTDDKRLLDRALKAANKRVVVKRPARGHALADQPPSFTVDGRRVRFDVHLTSPSS